MATLVYTGKNVTLTRKAIKEMAREGGHHEVKVDMRAPSDEDARTLLYMASGAHPREIDRWRMEVRDKRAAAYRYPSVDRRGRRMAYDYDADADRIEMRGPQCRYKADPHYELRMAEWAEEVMSRNV